MTEGEPKIEYASSPSMKKGRFRLVTPTPEPNQFKLHYEGRNRSLADSLFWVGVFRWMASKFGANSFYYVTSPEDAEKLKK